MTKCDLSSVWAREAADEPYIRPSWHVTIANERNCDALGVPYDPSINKAIFVFGLIANGEDVSLGTRRPSYWPEDKKWQQCIIVEERELSSQQTIAQLQSYWIGPKRVEEAKALLEKEGYAQKPVDPVLASAELVMFPQVFVAEQRMRQMAAQIPSGPNLQHE